MLTTYDTDSYVLPAIEAGATGYLLKDAPRAELLHAVRAAAQGQAVLSPAVTARLMSRVRAPGAGPLSHRELEVLELVASGADQPGGGRPAVHHRGHGQDPPAEHLRQARRRRPCRRGRRGVQPRPAHSRPTRTPVAPLTRDSHVIPAALPDSPITVRPMKCLPALASLAVIVLGTPAIALAAAATSGPCGAPPSVLAHQDQAERIVVHRATLIPRPGARARFFPLMCGPPAPG